MKLKNKRALAFVIPFVTIPSSEVGFFFKI